MSISLEEVKLKEAEVITIETQEELDKLPFDQGGTVKIIGGTKKNPLRINKSYQSATVIVGGNAYIDKLTDNVHIDEVTGYSIINNMYSYASIQHLSGHAVVNNMQDFASIVIMKNNSCIINMEDSAFIHRMCDNCKINNMCGNASVKVYSEECKINAIGDNIIQVLEGLKLKNININKYSKLIRFNTFDTCQSVDFYLRQYPAKKSNDGKSLIMYKACHKNSETGAYFSNYNYSFTYEIGKSYTEKCSSNINRFCDEGLHVGDLNFAIGFAYDWDDLAILEVEVPIDSIVVTTFCTGEIRTSKLKVLRELSKSEITDIDIC
jgi:hypothetical protein